MISDQYFPQPVIFGPSDVASAEPKMRTAVKSLLSRCGEHIDDVFQIVIGERNLWVWRFKQDDEGSRYLVWETNDGLGEQVVAYEVNRYDLELVA